MKSKHIVFSGTDGAGKSTQIDLLVQYLQNDGQEAINIWSRGGYTPFFNFIKKIIRKVLGKKLPAPGKSKKRETIIKKPLTSKIWLTLAICDLIFLYGVYVRYLVFCGKTVICDRYIEDTKLDFTKNFSNNFNPNGVLWKLLEFLSSRPDFSFLLLVPPKESQRRSKLKNEPFPDDLETLNFRYNCYRDKDWFSSVYKKFDGLRPIDDIHQDMVSLIEN